MKLAILLYGIFRHQDSSRFWNMMLPPGDIFVFSTFTRYPNTSRSRDIPLKPNNTFPMINNAKYWSIVDQNTYDKEHNILGILNNKRHYAASFSEQSWQNAVRALFQISSLKQLFQEHDTEYTHILLSRVDLLFTRIIETDIFKNTVTIPNYATFGGENDRFLAGPKHDVLCLMDRLEIALNSSHVFHIAERLLSKVVKHCNTRVFHTNIGYARRIRGMGYLHPAQYKLNKSCSFDTAKKIEELKPYKYIKC